MGGMILRLCLLVAGALAFGIASPLQARDVAPTCHAEASAPQIARGAPAQWRCSGAIADFRAERAMMRFDLAPGEVTPAYFVSRASHFESILIRVHQRGGAVREQAFTMDDGRLTGSGLDFVLPLPATEAPVQRVEVFIDRPWVGQLVGEARLVGPGEQRQAPDSTILLLAAICGLVVTPIFLNLAFYRILRARFLIWHSLATVGWLGLTLVSSGLAAQFVALDIATTSTLLPVFSCLAVTSAALFGANLFEEGCLPRLTRRLLRLAAVATVIGSAFYAMKFETFRSMGVDLYYFSFLALLVLFLVALGQALRRGSRAAWFQLVACLPLFAMVVYRLATNLGAGQQPQDGVVLVSVAYAFELIVTTIGAADRFMTMKRERDRALIQATAMEEVAERDPLTGLMNRRGIQPRFAELHRAGYATFALIDLDHFKSINDTYGHAKGDEVLRVVAGALATDENAMAMRMGGEEFMLLVRGADARLRAEKLRQAITLRVGREVQGLDHVVTASMGLLEAPQSALPSVDFDTIYTRIDKLLYEAKANGRNRTASEKIKAFVGTRALSRRSDRRRAA